MDTRDKPATCRHSAKLRERTVRMIRQFRVESGQKQGSITRVADQPGCGVESSRSWVRQADIGSGRRSGTASQKSTGGKHSVFGGSRRLVWRASESGSPTRARDRGDFTRLASLSDYQSSRLTHRCYQVDTQASPVLVDQPTG